MEKGVVIYLFLYPEQILDFFFFSSLFSFVKCFPSPPRAGGFMVVSFFSVAFLGLAECVPLRAPTVGLRQNRCRFERRS